MKILNYIIILLLLIASCLIDISCSSSKSSSTPGNGTSAQTCAASVNSQSVPVEFPVQVFNFEFQKQFTKWNNTKSVSIQNRNDLYPLANHGIHLASSANALSVSTSDPNVVSLTVGCGYLNQPCVSAKICVPGSTTNCVTVDNLLLDTGSSGLRIFKSALSGFDANLSSQTTAAGNPMAECVQYGDGSTHWGALKTADIILGQRTAPNIAIQVIDPTYASTPPCSSACTTGNADQQMTGYSGILGVRLNQFDCGTSCQNASSNDYYSCPNNTTCTSIAANTSGTTALQLSNPVFAFAIDNNGLIIQFPSIPSENGASSLTGKMIFGIGTQTNNTPVSATAIRTFSDGSHYTLFNGTKIGGFLDSGSNNLNLPTGAFTTCTNSSTFCPATSTDLSSAIIDKSSSSQIAFTYSVANAQTLNQTGNKVFDNRASDSGATNSIIWGFPFFIGNTVYFGFEGKTVSTLGTGPLLAF